MHLTSRFSIAVVLACGLAWAPVARAEQATAYNHPVTWSLPFPGIPCPQLPAGVSVDGRGTQHVTVQIINGIERVLSTATGTAADSDGNQYQWLYVNHNAFDIVTGEGHFTDRFDLIGRKGNARNYKVYLDWNVTIDPDLIDSVPPEEILFFATSFDPIVTIGDLNCDPI